MRNSRLVLLLAFAVPMMAFAVIYAVAVRPARASQQVAAARAVSLVAQRSREVPAGGSQPVASTSDASFERLTSRDDRSSEVADAVRVLLEAPDVGAGRNVSIQRSDVTQEGPLAYRPVVVKFEAPYTGVERFFSRLRGLPTAFQLRNVDIEQAPDGRLIRTRVLLHVYQRPAPAAATPLVAAAAAPTTTIEHSGPEVRKPIQEIAKTAPKISASPIPARVRAADSRTPPQEEMAEKDPVVNAILFSSRYKAALVDGRIVRVGDHLGSGLVSAIEKNSVVYYTASGIPRRLVLYERGVRVTPQ